MKPGETYLPSAFSSIASAASIFFSLTAVMVLPVTSTIPLGIIPSGVIILPLNIFNRCWFIQYYFPKEILKRIYPDTMCNDYAIATRLRDANYLLAVPNCLLPQQLFLHQALNK